MATSFRQKFNLPVSKKSGSFNLWFPRHMFGNLKHMQARLRTIDALVEVHDARIPFTGRNITFEQTMYGNAVKPHILVLNKFDLIDQNLKEPIETQLRSLQPSLKLIHWMNCKLR